MRIDTIDADILDDPDQTREWLEGVDAIVAATDNNPSRLLLNRIAVETGTPVVFGRAFVRASGGDVIRVRPQDRTVPATAASSVSGSRRRITPARSSAAPAYADRPSGQSLACRSTSPPSHTSVPVWCSRAAPRHRLRTPPLEEDLPGSLFLWANRREAASRPVMGKRPQPGGPALVRRPRPAKPRL